MQCFEARSYVVSRVLSVLMLVGCTSSSTSPNDAAVPHDPRMQATARATLSPLGQAASTEQPVSADATFVATRSSVDLFVTMRGCAGVPEKPLRILEARSCDGVTAESPIWNGERGGGIPGPLCTSGSSGEGFLGYSRRSELEQRWAIGDGSAQDVVGHAIALFDPMTLAPTACGVIELGDDRVTVPLPAPDQAPSADVRAQLAGVCLTRLMPGAADGACIDATAIAECASEHCQLGACLEQCASYTACLDAAPDSCAATSTCEVTLECMTCQNEVRRCAFGLCGGLLTCPSTPRPGGPCSSLFACCTLQGERASSCIETAAFISSLGGEPSCINGLTDWDVVSHLHVPCDTEAAFLAALDQAQDNYEAPPVDGAFCMTQTDCGDDLCVGAFRSATLSSPGRCQPREAVSSGLGDHFAGNACASDAACGGGLCAAKTALLTPFPDGYCTARCYEDASCGQGGACVAPVGATEPGYCYQACASDQDCARDHYRCTPLGDGARVISVCYPREDSLPDQIVGEPCQQHAECGSAIGQCLEGMPLSFLANQVIPTPDGYCSAPCLLDEDCGAGAQCVSGGETGGLCMAICDEQQAPCREGYRCFAHLRDGDPEQKVCMPIWDNPQPSDAGL